MRTLRIGVIGAGVMGGGIAQIVADKTSASVRMRDINWDAIAGGMRAGRVVQRLSVGSFIAGSIVT